MGGGGERGGCWTLDSWPSGVLDGDENQISGALDSLDNHLCRVCVCSRCSRLFSLCPVGRCLYRMGCGASSGHSPPPDSAPPPPPPSHPPPSPGSAPLSPHQVKELRAKVREERRKQQAALQQPPTSSSPPAVDSDKEEEPLSDNVLIRRRQIAARKAAERAAAEEAEAAAVCTFAPAINPTSSAIASSPGVGEGAVYGSLLPPPSVGRRKSAQRLASDYASGSPFAFVDYVAARARVRRAKAQAEMTNHADGDAGGDGEGGGEEDGDLRPSPRTLLPNLEERVAAARTVVLKDFRVFYRKEAERVGGSGVVDLPPKAEVLALLDRLADARSRGSRFF